MEVKLIIKDFCNSTDIINQIKSQAEMSGCSIKLPSLQINVSGYTDKKTIKKPSYKLYVIATTIFSILEFLEPIRPYIMEFIKKDPRQEISIESKTINIKIKTDQDVVTILESIKEVLDNKKK